MLIMASSFLSEGMCHVRKHVFGTCSPAAATELLNHLDTFTAVRAPFVWMRSLLVGFWMKVSHQQEQATLHA